MLTDQLTSILNDTTAIERLKKEERVRPEHDSCLYALSETFGRPCSLTWLVPTSVKFNGLTYEQLSVSELAHQDVDYDAPRGGAQQGRERADSHDEMLSEDSDSDGGGPLGPRYAHSTRERGGEGDHLAPRHSARYAHDDDH
jgi:hypothetical protein